MEEQLNPLAITHLLQHTLRTLCIHDNSQWVYAVFWRILPRNYPPPKWDLRGGAYDRTRGNRRNWILVWEDGFCNFAASAAASDCEAPNMRGGLQPELFFKMSHEIYNYGEGFIGKVAADHSHKWVYKESQDQEIDYRCAWNNPADSHPRTWEAQFQSGIKTIALIAVREGVVQLGATHKVVDDLSFVVLLRKKFSYIESIPGVLLPHPSSSAFPARIDDAMPDNWQTASAAAAMPPSMEFYDHFSCPQVRLAPSMSSLEALLSKLPSVGPAPSSASMGYYEMPMAGAMSDQRQVGVAKEEMDDLGGESSSSMASYYVNVGKHGEGY